MLIFQPHLTSSSYKKEACFLYELENVQSYKHKLDSLFILQFFKQSSQARLHAYPRNLSNTEAKPDSMLIPAVFQTEQPSQTSC